jgi:hypothetical protein
VKEERQLLTFLFSSRLWILCTIEWATIKTNHYGWDTLLGKKRAVIDVFDLKWKFVLTYFLIRWHRRW